MNYLTPISIMYSLSGIFIMYVSFLPNQTTPIKIINLISGIILLLIGLFLIYLDWDQGLK